MSNSCLHACPFAGLRSSAKLRFARVVRPRLAAQATATRFAGCLATLCQPLAWRVRKTGRKRLSVTSLYRCFASIEGTPSLRPPRVPSLNALGTARETGSRGSLQSPGARATPPPSPRPLGRSQVSAPPTPQTAFGSVWVAWCTLDAGLGGSPALRLRFVGLRLNALPPHKWRLPIQRRSLLSSVRSCKNVCYVLFF